MKNKVYIWDNVLEDYTYGMAVAIAPNKKTAIKLLLQEFFKDEPTVLPGSRFEKELNGNKCYICDINIPFAIYQMGGS